MQVPPTPAFNTHLVWNGIDEVDPYLWLEDSKSPQVQQWVADQDQYTQQTLTALPLYNQVKQRLTELIQSGLPRLAQTAAGITVYQKTNTGDKQPRIYKLDASGKESLLIDPMRRDPDGHLNVAWFSLSPDGRYLAYATAKDGTDDQTLQVLDLKKRGHLPEEIPLHPRRRPGQESIPESGPPNSLQWTPDGKSFYYAGYQPVGFFRHTVGTDPKQDPLISQDTMGEDEAVSLEGRYLAFSTYQDWSTEKLNVYDTQTGTLTSVPAKEGVNYLPKLYQGTLYAVTNDGAPNSHLVAFDPTNLASPREVLPPLGPGNSIFPPAPGTPDRGALLRDFAVTPTHIYGVYLDNAVSRLVQFDTQGHFQKEIPLPSMGTIDWIKTMPDGTVNLNFSSMSEPHRICQVDEAGGTLKTLTQDSYPGYNPDDYTEEQVWGTSKDGTQFPVTLVHRKDVKPNPNTPTVQTGYGGFDLDYTPEFNSTVVPLLERGGTYALATLRGGGEYGEPWHQDGMLANKQHVFDDFAAAGQALIAKGYTSKPHFGAIGASNGGLLAATAVTETPNEYNAVAVDVPLTDMDRYDQITDNAYVNEYGTSQDPQQAPYLNAYSPYQNIQPGTAYPEVLVQSGSMDQRVGPEMARKFVARLQAANSSGAPIMLREDARTGHGPGTPIDIRIDEIADEWTMLLSRIQ